MSLSTVPSLAGSGPGSDVGGGVDDVVGGVVEGEGGVDDVVGGNVEGEGGIDDVGNRDDEGVVADIGNEEAGTDVSSWQDVSTSIAIIRRIGQLSFGDNLIYRYCNTTVKERKVALIPKPVISAPGRFDTEVLRHQIHSAVSPAHTTSGTAG